MGELESRHRAAPQKGGEKMSNGSDAKEVDGF